MFMPTKITCIIELKPKEEQNVYGRVKSDYMYNESFSTSRLLILYAALVTVSAHFACATLNVLLTVCECDLAI